MTWGRNSNYRHNPCWDCPKKGCGAYHDICPTNKAWKDEKEKERQARVERIQIIDAINTLEHHRIVTRKR